jgi:hypothetical protein
MGHQQAMVFYAQNLAKQRPILSDGLLAVATIAIDVKLAIAPMAIASLSSGAEGRHALAQIIIL